LADFLTELSIFFSGVTAIVALLVLWYTALKGPSLELVSRFEATLSASPPDVMLQPTSILQLNRIEIQPIALVFANNGSRSGVIAKIDAIFVPSDSFKRFYDRMISQVWVRHEDPQKSSELPTIVAAGGTAVIGLSMTLGLRDWKDVARTISLRELTLENALRKVWEEGKHSLAEFSKFTGEIGSVSLHVQRARRQLGKIRLTYDHLGPDARIGTIPEWVRKRAATCLDKFEEMLPSDGDVARYIRVIFESFFYDFKKNIETLKTGISNQAPALLDTQAQLTTLTPSNATYYQVVMERDEDLAQRLADYYDHVGQFRDRVLGSSPGLTKDSPEMSVLIHMMEKLLKDSEELLARLTSFKKELISSTKHLIGEELPATKN